MGADGAAAMQDVGLSCSPDPQRSGQTLNEETQSVGRSFVGLNEEVANKEGLHTHGSAGSRGSAWWWVPVVAPLVGAALGTGLYQLFVAFHHPEEEEEEDGGRARRQTKH